MSNLNQFGGSAPLRVTTLTSGTGTHTFLTGATRYRARLCGGGGGGSRPAVASANNASGGGGAAATVDVEMPITSASEAYVVGAAGVGATANGTFGTSGGNSLFGTLLAPGGGLAIHGDVVSGNFNYGGLGGYLGNRSDTHQANATVEAAGSPAPGIAGGAGGSPGSGSFGCAPGFPGVIQSANGQAANNGSAANGTNGTRRGGGGGGDCALGKGGAGGNGNDAGTGSNGANATGYGGGGGGGGNGNAASGNGGNGTGGRIIIEEY